MNGVFGLIKKFIVIVLLNTLCTTNGFAANWVKLQDNKHAVLMLDKQSISESGKFQKAWVKVDYKALQQNLEYAEKRYDRAKMLWYFNCKEQKSATAQVYQLLNEEQVYSAALDVKRARFLEPVPETEIDIAMQYVCKQYIAKQTMLEKKEKAKAKTASLPEPTTEQSDKKEAAPVKKTESQSSDQNKKANTKKQAADKPDKPVEEKHEEKQNADKHDEKHSKDADDDKDIKWGYQAKEGPEFWSELSPHYSLCQSGQNQSPIDIKEAITATPKKLKVFQRFPINEFYNNHGVLEASFKRGNMVVIDKVMYQMKSVQFHAPSEHSIDGQSYPMEAQFLLREAKGRLAMMAVMFEEGASNPALSKLWKQMPKSNSKKRKLKSKVSASELLPIQKRYYRFSGSLTMPPCTEGVIWLVMKSPMSASDKQLKKLKKTIKHDNNRPLQPLNGRMVIEQ